MGEFDLLFLQEVYGSWSEGADQAAKLAELSQCLYAFLPTECRWGHNSRGNGVLARVPVQSLYPLPLPGTQACRFRCAVLVLCRFNGKDVRILGVHCDDRQDHVAQLRALRTLFLSLEEPAVLIGDLNTYADDPEFQQMLADPGVTACIGETWDDREPLRSVDWIVARGLECCDSGCSDNGASDHPFLWAELQLLVTAEER